MISALFTLVHMLYALQKTCFSSAKLIRNGQKRALKRLLSMNFEDLRSEIYK